MPAPITLTAKDHALYQQLQECIELSKDVKNSLYPKNTNTKKYYSDKLPSKLELNAIRTSIKSLEKHVVSLLKQKNEIAKTTKSNGGNTYIRLKPDIAAFIGTQKKGLGDVYINTLLTQWFTNYFFVNQLENGVYIVPNDKIIKLFRSSLEAMGVVDHKGNLVERVENGRTVKGFRFIRLQKLFSNHIVMDAETGKRLTVKCDDKNVQELLKREKRFMEDIKNARHELTSHKKAVTLLEKNKKKAELFGDGKEVAKKLTEHKRALTDAYRVLEAKCREASFPLYV